jgi:hypothetical protein
MFFSPAKVQCTFEQGGAQAILRLGKNYPDEACLEIVEGRNKEDFDLIRSPCFPIT